MAGGRRSLGTHWEPRNCSPSRPPSPQVDVAHWEEGATVHLIYGRARDDAASRAPTPYAVWGAEELPNLDVRSQQLLFRLGKGPRAYFGFLCRGDVVEPQLITCDHHRPSPPPRPLPPPSRPPSPLPSAPPPPSPPPPPPRFPPRARAPSTRRSRGPRRPHSKCNGHCTRSAPVGKRGGRRDEHLHARHRTVGVLYEKRTEESAEAWPRPSSSLRSAVLGGFRHG